MQLKIDGGNATCRKPMSAQERYTASGVRLRLVREGDASDAFDWLFLPGGPGLGSESLRELAASLDVPGRYWLVDLPGDGSNVAHTSAKTSPYAAWPHALAEAARLFPRAVFVGHSTGGMYLLSVPELEHVLAGLVLVSSAPDASWRSAFAEMTVRAPLPDVERAMTAYEKDKSPNRLRDLAVASAPWNFGKGSVEKGRALLANLPYNVAAVEWSEQAFDDTYAATWWPEALPVLIISGDDDRIVTQSLWETPRFQGANVLHRVIEGGAHFPWIERPGDVREAFHDLADRILRGNPGAVSGVHLV